MVPHSLETEEKMKCLYYLYACLDTNAVRSISALLDFGEHVLIVFSRVKGFAQTFPLIGCVPACTHPNFNEWFHFQSSE